MLDQDNTPELARIESIIDEQGLDEAVSFVFSSARDDFDTRLACLEEACGITLGPDETKWQAWLQDLQASGASGFGAVASDSAERVPADVEVITNLMSEVSGPSRGRDAREDQVVSAAGITEVSARGPHQAPGIRQEPEHEQGLTQERRPPSRRQIGNYEVVEKLGEGGMGTVYKARQLTMDRIVAFKVLASWLARDKGYVARFIREAKLAAKLDHPNIVRGIDAGSVGKIYYFAMEYVEGEALSKTLKREKRLDEIRALSIATQIARGLEHAWENGLVHRDVKPENIMLMRDGGVKLTDLGLAKAIDSDMSSMTQTGVSVGTPYYMSPEQVRADKDVDIRSDVYALGATLYHLVTGRPPFTGKTPIITANKHLTDSPVYAHERNPEVSLRTSSIIEKMMEKAPGDRYESPAQVIEDLKLVIGGKDPKHAAAILNAMSSELRHLDADDIEAEETDADPVKRLSRSPLLIGGAVLGLLAGAGLFVAFGGRQERKPVGGGLLPADNVAAEDDAPPPAAPAPAAARQVNAADLVEPRQSARRAAEDAKTVPLEEALSGTRARMQDLLTRAEKALGEDRYAEALKLFDGSRQAADEILAARSLVASCRDAAEQCAAARAASEALSQFAPAEWRVAEGALRAAENEREKGSFSKAARAYEAARLAYTQHRSEALQPALSKWLAAAAKAEASGDLKTALGIYQRAAAHGAQVQDKAAAIANEVERADAVAQAKQIAQAEGDKRASAMLADALRRWPGDHEVSQALDEVRSRLRSSGTLEVDLGDGVRLSLVCVAPGSFLMGSREGDEDETPVHEVAISRGLYVGATEITQAQYESLMGGNPSFGKDPTHPVNSVSWADAVEFCKRLSDKTGKRYRLPTEAEWEYSARAGAGTEYSFGDNESDLGVSAWYASNTRHGTQPVGKKQPNSWGLYDCHGNVWEWCADPYAEDYYAISPPADPTGPATGELRVLRGGSRMSDALRCRAAERIKYSPDASYVDVGFRVVREW